MPKRIDERILAGLTLPEDRERNTAAAAPRAAPREPDFVGTGRFQILRKIGAGGMGVVYEALDKSLGTTVALKTLRHLDPDALLRFKNEFRSLQDLSHPNLVSLGELFEDTGRWFFTMELALGEDLGSHVRCSAASGFDEVRLRPALVSVARALQAIHARGLVHRDIKPSNIRVTPAGRVVLLDFGLVTSTLGPRYTLEGTVVGTAAYMAPEQASSERVGPAADLYALGVILFKLLTGKLPFEGSAIQVLAEKQHKTAVDPRTLVAEAPEDLSLLCVKLLAVDPNDRPTASDVLARLGAFPTELATTDSTFVGREQELASLRSAFLRTRAGSAVTVYVHGESGMGKSALIRRFTEVIQAERSDVVVLNGRCYERESVPYKALDGIIDALTRQLLAWPDSDVSRLLPAGVSLLARIFPVLDRVPQVQSSPPVEVHDPQELRNLMFATLRRLFSLIAERQPLVLVIDDLQWSDGDSALLLADLMRPPDAPPLLLLVSSRNRAQIERDAQKSLFDTRGTAHVAMPGGELCEISLQPLTAAAAEALAVARLGPGAEPTAARSIAREANGHPLFIDELARHAARDPEERTRVRLDDAIWQRVQGLVPEARRVVELVSIAVAPLPPEVFLKASGLGPSEFAQHVNMLRAANLVRGRSEGTLTRLEPYHDRVREAVQQHLDKSALEDCHRDLATALEQSPQLKIRPELLLRHLEAAGRDKDAAHYAAEAADIAARSLAFDRASELYRSALRLGEHDAPERQRLLVALAESLANAGRGESSADVYLEAAQSAEVIPARSYRAKAVRQLLVTGHIRRGLAALESLLAEVGETLPKSERDALLSFLWQRLKLRARGLSFVERDEDTIPPSELAKLDVFMAAGDGLGVVDPVLGVSFLTRHLLLALRVGNKKRISRAFGLEAVFLASTGKVSAQRIQALLAEGERIANEMGDPYLSAAAALAHGIVDYFGGRFLHASVRLKSAEGDLRQLSDHSTLELNNVRLIRLLALEHLGEFATVASLLDRYLLDAERRGDRYMETSLERVCSYAWFAEDRPERARIGIERTTWSPPSGGYHLQDYYAFLARSLLALYEQTVPAEIETLRREFMAFCRSNLKRVSMPRVMAYTVWGRTMISLATVPEHRAASRREAMSMAKRLEAEGVAHAAGYAALIRAGLSEQNGDADTVQWFERAVSLSEESGMGFALAGAHHRLGELLGSAEGERHRRLAREWTTKQRIANPERMFAMIAPPTATRN